MGVRKSHFAIWMLCLFVPGLLCSCGSSSPKAVARLSSDTPFSFSQAETAPLQNAIGLDHQVQKYNSLLRKARDANHNIAILLHPPKPGVTPVSVANRNMAMIYQGQQQSYLMQALQMRALLKNSPLFRKKYAEGDLCLHRNEISPGLQQTSAENLRFYKKK